MTGVEGIDCLFDLKPCLSPVPKWSLACQEQTMKKKRFTEEQIIAVLKESEAGAAKKGAVPQARDL